MEEFVVLDDSYLDQMASLFSNAFKGEPWNDDWSDKAQLSEYIKEISKNFNALNFGLLIDGKLAAMSVGMIRHWWEGTNYNIDFILTYTRSKGNGGQINTTAIIIGASVGGALLIAGAVVLVIVLKKRKGIKA